MRFIAEQTCAMIFGSWTFNKDEASGYVTSSEAFTDDYHLVLDAK